MSKWCGDENCLQCADKEPDPYVHLPREEYVALREQNRVLREAVIWALGYHDFRERQEGEGPYWWRRELMHRSGLTQGDLDQAMRLDETAEQLTDIMLQHKKKAALTATSQEGQHG